MKQATRRDALRLAWGLGAAMGPPLAARAAKPAALHWHETALLAFGTTVWLRAAHSDERVAQRGVAAAAAAVQRVDQLMSLFRPDSEIVRLNRQGVLHAPAEELLRVLRLARQVAWASGGLFDPTVQPLWQLWQQATRAQRRPQPAELRAALAHVGWQGLHITPQRIAFNRPGMAITLNGIAQGFAADEAAAALRQHGIEHALLQTGEWLPLGQPGSGERWQLGVANPRRAQDVLATIVADGRAIACSSDDKMSFSADQRDHHILDPRSGYSPAQLACVVVLAPSCALADALTKPLFMGSAAQALALAKHWQVDVVALAKSGHMVASPGVKLQAPSR